MRHGAVPLAAGAALLACSCGAPLMRLPPGPGVSADATTALAEATRACRDISTVTAEITVRGSIAGRGVRARLLAGLAAPDALRIEAVAPFGQPAFIVVAQRGDATAVLSDDRVLEHGDPEAVLEALTGVRIDAEGLRRVLTGCGTAPAPENGRALGGGWLVVPDGTTDLFLRRSSDDAAWRLVAAVHRPPDAPGWRAEYRDFSAGLPQSVRLASPARDRFNLRLTMAQVDVNEPLGPEVFEVRVPADSVAISIDELRQSTPWTSGGD